MKKFTLFKATAYKSNENKPHFLESAVCNRPFYIELWENERSTKSKFKIYGLPSSFSISREFEFDNRMYCNVGYKYMYYYSVPTETYNYDYFVRLKSRENPTINKFDFNQPYEAVLYENAKSQITSIAFKLFNGEREIAIEVDSTQNNMTVDIDILMAADDIITTLKSGIQRSVGTFKFSAFHNLEENVNDSADLVNSILGFDYIKVHDDGIILPDSDGIWLDSLDEAQSIVRSHVHDFENFENEF